MLEPGRSLAMFATPPSAIKLTAEGEIVGDASSGAEVVRIEREQVVVRYQGNLIPLRVQRAKRQAASEAENAVNGGPAGDANAVPEDQ
jgi:hypothetical protein